MFRFWIRCVACCFLTLLVGGMSVLRADEPVTIESQAEGLVVKIGGKEFTVFHHGPSLRKPYFWPVLAADGALLTRPIDPN